MTCKKCKDCRTPRCDPGSYGDACNKPCNPNCRALPCAFCSCEVCADGGFCVNGCDSGWYGNTCDEVCPENCFSEHRLAASCHQGNGSCVYGCARGFHGNRCNETCSGRCLKTMCRQTTSQCSLGCVDGFGGEFCNEEINEFGADQVAGAVGGAFVVILWGAIVIILICVIWRRRMREYASLNKSKHLYRNGSRNSSRRPLHRQGSNCSHAGNCPSENSGCHGFEIDMPVGTPAIEAFNHTHLPYVDESPIHRAIMTNHVMCEPIRSTSGGATEYTCIPDTSEYNPETSGESRVRFTDDDGDGLYGDEDVSEVSEVWKLRKY